MKELFHKVDFSHLHRYVNINMFKNVLYFSGGIIVFLLGLITYGVFLNYKEVPLSTLMKEKNITEFSNPVIIVDRKNYSLQLYDDTILVKTYKANFGRDINTQKILATDMATPVGEYEVCKMDSVYVYHKFIKINYPNVNDACEALRKDLIDQQEFDKIKYQNEYIGNPDSSAILGGNIGIQGIGKYNYIFKNLPFNFNWTNGSIAISNENIDELFAVIRKGTKVVIK